MRKRYNRPVIKLAARFILLLTILVGLSSGAAESELIIVAENHGNSQYRELIAQMISNRANGFQCVFLEDSPEMDEVAKQYLSGEKSFAAYRDRYVETGIKFGFSKNSGKRIFRANYSSLELVLKAAKGSGAKVFHFDYSTTSKYQPLSNEQISWNWNYIGRHQIMTENVLKRSGECAKAVMLVGEAHIDINRIADYVQLKRGYRADTHALKPLSHWLREAGVNAKSLNVSFDTRRPSTPAQPLRILDPKDLSEVQLADLGARELKLIKSAYQEFGLKPNYQVYDGILIAH